MFKTSCHYLSNLSCRPIITCSECGSQNTDIVIDRCRPKFRLLFINSIGLIITLQCYVIIYNTTSRVYEDCFIMLSKAIFKAKHPI
jgi:hypothetical protein